MIPMGVHMYLVYNNHIIMESFIYLFALTFFVNLG